MSARQPAPGSLSLVEDFVNTWSEDGEEFLAPSDFARWCVAHAIAPDGTEADDAAVARARAVREALRSLLLANNGYPLDPAAVRTLNEFAARVPHYLQSDASGRLALEPAGATVDAALARILLAVHQAMAEGTWPRLKACRAESCTWAFYDSSKNHSAAWCSMRVCGNRQKARRFRTRRRTESAQA